MRPALLLAIAGTLAATAAYAVPVPQPDSMVVEQCSEATLNVLANDAETSTATPLRVVSVTNGVLGTAQVVSHDTIQYIAKDKVGTDTLVYVIANAAGETVPGTVVVAVKEGSACPPF